MDFSCYCNKIPHQNIIDYDNVLTINQTQTNYMTIWHHSVSLRKVTYSHSLTWGKKCPYPTLVPLIFTMNVSEWQRHRHSQSKSSYVNGWNAVSLIPLISQQTPFRSYRSVPDPHNGSLADMGQHWSSSVSVWSSVFRLSDHGSAYQISASSNGFIVCILNNLLAKK